MVVWLGDGVGVGVAEGEGSCLVAVEWVGAAEWTTVWCTGCEGVLVAAACDGVGAAADRDGADVAEAWVGLAEDAIASANCRRACSRAALSVRVRSSMLASCPWSAAWSAVDVAAAAVAGALEGWVSAGTAPTATAATPRTLLVTAVDTTMRWVRLTGSSRGVA